ncbi:MAG: hypothetical protein H6590_08385 [Flavobacteriales bacterium]|nr:hypothetical protein [Flavobacteriales bacterium]MCB9179421.1 hypothetical protein [Flavobacteriales bacterium]
MNTATNTRPIDARWYWVAVVASLVALVIDLTDHQVTKTIGTAGVVLGFIGLALWRTTGRRVFNGMAVVGFLLFIGLTVYRLALHQGWIG